MRTMLPAAIMATAITLVGAGAAVAETPKPVPRWSTCVGKNLDGLECSTVRVPLDYSRPDGRTIELAISRKASRHPEKRRGVLLLNPGGPGLVGLTAPNLLGLSQQIQDSYDVIGFDPRGVGRSTPLTCDLDLEQQADASNPPFPHNARDVTAAAAFAQQVAHQCTTSKTSDLLPYISTANTARDLDRIREALGAPKLSYYGASYGTYLGAVYTTLFPGRSDRIVLDSSLPPDGYTVSALRAQGSGFETRFPDFADWVTVHAKSLGTTPAAVRAKYFELAARLDKSPQNGMDGTAFRATTSGLIRDNSVFPFLADIWQKLDTNTYPQEPVVDRGDNLQASYLGVVCGDSRWPRSVATYQANVAIDRVRSPMYGPLAANIRACAYWPSPTASKVRITGAGPSNVLIVQNLRDPATPLAGARQMRAALGHRARMVTVDQGGHGVYTAANLCGKAAVDTFLTTGKRPQRDTFCQ
ncbi:alpha/beta hydrolase [Kribbella sp. DT2]|uniref:alpha/beta hydrolase n=1 Tax=Kribbella sp. DT2 TaxID=3393427 RepID=UPI003CF43F1E